MKIFAGAGVDRRYSIMDAESVFTATSFEEKNDIYTREATKLAKSSLEKALAKAAIKPIDAPASEVMKFLLAGGGAEFSKLDSSEG